MTNRKMYTLPTTQSTKRDEIDLVQKLAVDLMAAGQSYLSMLFTPDFVNWVVAQIENDFSTDLFSTYCIAVDESNRQVDRINSLLNELNMSDTVLASDRAEHAAKVKDLENAVQHARDCADSEHAKLVDAHDRLFTATLEVERLTSEVNRLKIKLFDMMDDKS